MIITALVLGVFLGMTVEIPALCLEKLLRDGYSPVALYCVASWLLILLSFSFLLLTFL